MGDLTRNISRWEVACGDNCGLDTIDLKTGNIVQGACDHFSDVLGFRVHLVITSGYRCEKYNTKIRGSKNSWHMKGRAIDHFIRFVTPQELYQYYCDKYPGKFGIGLYVDKVFVHFDTAGRLWRKST